MDFCKQYFADFSGRLTTFLSEAENVEKLDAMISLLKSTKQTKRKIYLVGNGGSSAIAEHMAIDLTKNAKLKALAISGSPMLTTFANDYGYDKVFSSFINHFGEPDDIVIAISSGGKSANIVEACKAAKNKGATLVTFTGFAKNNPVSLIGDINFWVDSNAFGYVEILHNLLIHYVNDAVIGSAVY
jgi:D-sedoheptulose 7-phosphate isomerase